MPTLHDLLELSTAHLPPHLADRLSSIPGVHAHAYLSGWLMWIPDPGDEPHPTPDDNASAVPGGCDVLTPIHRYAQALGCTCVLFARDAEIIDDLPSWEW